MNPCNACPRKCNVDRSKELGWCRMDNRIHISSIVIHRGEEPPISGEKGIVNVFFPSCNMQCIYCQNWQISCRGTQGMVMTLDEVCNAIIELLPLSENNLGFVSPSHFIPQMENIVEELKRLGYYPTIVYNSNGYDRYETIKSLEKIVDVWLPDFKYTDDNIASELSLAPNYSKIALAAIKTMMHQTGATLQTDDRGIARRGIIIRHLVLPGFVENSISVLKLISEDLSPNLHVSIMSQYYPPCSLIKNSTAKLGGVPRWREPGVGLSNQNLSLEPERSRARSRQTFKSLKRTITHSEYESVLEAFYSFGFHRGWVQDLESHFSYRPDFYKKRPFFLT
jgi:putative pyruvate formate lyase activating enzyme